MAKIFLSGKKGKGFCALVDDEMYEELNRLTWYLGYYGYPVTGQSESSKGIPKAMHKFISPSPKNTKYQIDHINCNKLDNRRSNLRIASLSQQKMNLPISMSNSSGFKGVSFHKPSKKWLAQIKVDSKGRHLGLFAEVRNAALAYNTAAMEFFGDFARLNLIPKQ